MTADRVIAGYGELHRYVADAMGLTVEQPAARQLSDIIAKEAKDAGYRYGMDWGPWLDSMSSPATD